MSDRIQDRKDEQECSACGYPAKELKEYRNQNIIGPHANEKKLLCELCARTMLGTYTDYPDQHKGPELSVMRQITFVANAILDALERKP